MPQRVGPESSSRGILEPLRPRIEDQDGGRVDPELRRHLVEDDVHGDAQVQAPHDREVDRSERS